MPSSRLVSIPLHLLLAALFVAPFACADDDTKANPFVEDAGPDTAGPKLRCGQVGTLCAGNEWCAYELVGSCGRDGQTGNCKARPQNCAGDCPAVCGCDGKVYCNPCEAQAAGSDVDKNRDCLPKGGEVLSYALFTDPAKIALYKKDTERKICLRIILVKRLGTKYGLDVPNEWGVEGGEITNDPDDCSITANGLPPTPKGTSLAPVGGQGTISFSSDTGQQGKFPCSLSVAARLAFVPTPDYSWVPNVEPIAAENVTVSGGCP
jgi:hypothetical protein